MILKSKDREFDPTKNKGLYAYTSPMYSKWVAFQKLPNQLTTRRFYTCLKCQIVQPSCRELMSVAIKQGFYVYHRHHHHHHRHNYRRLSSSLYTLGLKQTYMYEVGQNPSMFIHPLLDGAAEALQTGQKFFSRSHFLMHSA